MFKQWIYLPVSALIIAGCGTPPPKPQIAAPAPKPEPKPATKPKPLPPKPKKNYKLKKVEDNNFDPSYMYPDAPSKPQKTPKANRPKPSDTPTVVSMSKEECISMIGEEKFDKYTQMLGGEAGAIKRCKMLKSMK